jgi:hypothetical protein
VGLLEPSLNHFNSSEIGTLMKFPTVDRAGVFRPCGLEGAGGLGRNLRLATMAATGPVAPNHLEPTEPRPRGVDAALFALRCTSPLKPSWRMGAPIAAQRIGIGVVIPTLDPAMSPTADAFDVDAEGWLPAVRQLRSPHVDERPIGTTIRFGGDPPYQLPGRIRRGFC